MGKVIVWLIAALVSLPLVATQRSSKSYDAEASTFAVEILLPKPVGRHLSDAIKNS